MQKHINQPTTERSDERNVILRGTILGLIAAVGYTAANIFLRRSTHVDPYWVSWVKAIPTVLLFGPWMLVLAERGERLIPPARPFILLVLAAILGQVGGNVVFQWSLGVIGLALTVPICLGAMIITGAVSGWLWLKETLTPRTIASILLLITAVTVLSLGAPQAQASLAEVATHNVQLVALGVVAAFFSGVSYALLGVAIRGAAQQGCPAATNVVVVGVAGVVMLLPICLVRSSFGELLETDRFSICWMLAAGLANAGAFIALTKSLQLVGVIYVNALNATQAAMAAVAGVIIFHEPPSISLRWGVALTALGLICMRRGSPKNVELASFNPSAGQTTATQNAEREIGE